MRRDHAMFGKSLLWFIAISIWLSGSGFGVVRAELAVGFFSDLTNKASSRLNDGIGDFNKMMGRLDVGDVRGAALFRDSAYTAMQEAASTYGEAVSKAGTRILEPRPENNQERAEVQFFQQN